MTRLEKRESLFFEYLNAYALENGINDAPFSMKRKELESNLLIGLPAVCQRLHENLTGSSERDPYQQVFDVMYLRAAIATWEPSEGPQWAAYDNAVKALVEAVLAEVKELPDLEREAA